MSIQLEVIAFNIESCVIAERAGAHRIELCDNPGEGGTTPSYGFIKQARSKTKIDLFPIIRPRGGDFLYSEEEFQAMQYDVEWCKKLGCDGIATGMLTENGDVDVERTQMLVKLAYPMSVTFHRAFDRTNDPLKAMEDIIHSGCERILTSGQCPTAIEGQELIASLVKKADNRIIIMPGSGVRSDNVNELIQNIGVSEIHSSARTKIKTSMKFIAPKMNESLDQVMLDQIEVEKIIKQIRSF